MEGIVGSLVILIVAQGGLIWHKLGKLERGLSDLCREVRDGNNKAK